MSTQLEIIKKDLELIRPSFEELNLTGLSFAKELEFAIQIFEKNSYLQGASKTSIQNAIKNVALSGLSLNPVLKYCYLIPRKERQVLQCLAEPSYVGLIKILTDTGSVVAISATIVYEKEIDSLVIQEGAGGHATHKHYLGKDNPGEPMACYTIAILPNGMKHVSLYRRWQWEEIMKRSESVKSYYAKQAKGEYAAIPTWISDQSEMIRKTAIKNHYKYLPKTERAEMIGNVIDLDNQANGIDFEKEKKAEEKKNMSIDIMYADEAENQEKFNSLKELLSDGIVPNVFKVGDKEINVVTTIEGMEKDFIDGALHKEKFEKWSNYFKSVHEKFSKSAANGN